MQVFVAERSLKGIAMQDLAAAQQRAIETAARFSRDGRPVKYLRSLFVPENGHCSCLFEADDAACVEAVNQAAQIPYDRVLPAMDLHA